MPNLGPSRKDPECRFCVITHERSPHSYDRPIISGDRFQAFASLGALLPGWTLVAPKRHVISLAELAPDEFAELEVMVSRLQGVLSAESGMSVATFEHGASVKRSAVGCGVDHAHMHVVPVPFSIRAALTVVLPQTDWALSSVDVGDMSPLRGREYIWFRDTDGTAYHRFDVSESQLIRRAIAESLGDGSHWDWKSFPRPDLAIETWMWLSQATLSGVSSSISRA